jgi:hypothetical protein
MRNTNKFFLGMFLALVTIGYFPLISAANSQWFPAEGSVSEFAISSFYTFLNGTKLESNKYDLVNLSGNIRAVPSMNKQYIWYNNPGKSIANATEISLRYTYTELTVNQWKRTPTFILGGNATSLPNLSVYLYYGGSGWSFRTFSGLDDSVYKNNFFTTLTGGAIVDYIDSTKGIGCEIDPTPHSVLAITPDHIIALHLGLGEFTVNSTIIAGRDGRVQVHILAGEGKVEPGLNDILTVGVCLTRLDSETSGIPSFPIILTAIGIIVSLLLVKMAQKHKTF